MMRASQSTYGQILWRDSTNPEEQEAFASAFDWCVQNPVHWVSRTMGAIERCEESGRYVTNGVGYVAITTRIEDLFKSPPNRGEPPDGIWIPSDALLDDLMGPAHLRDGKTFDYLRLRSSLEADLSKLGRGSVTRIEADWLAKVRQERNTTIAVI